MPRTLTLPVLSVIASVWACGMMVLGLWLVADAALIWPEYRDVLLAGGIAWVAAGLFVGMVVIADRLFPGARRFSWSMEFIAFGAFLALAVYALVLLIA